MTASSPNQAVDYSRKWYVMAAVAMSISLGTIDIGAVDVSLPTLTREFNTSFSVIQWVVLTSLLTQTSLMLTVGRLGDIIGKKPVYISGFVIFTVGLILCGSAPSIGWLLAFRAVQAIGTTLVIALVFGIVTEAFPPAERGKALGLVGAVVSVGIVIGPMLGGLLLDALSWRWIFFANVPVAIIGIVMAIRYVPDFRPAQREGFDYLGAVTFCLSLLPMMLAVTWGQRIGFGEPRILGLLAAAFVFAVIFVLVEWKSAQPLIDLRLFQNGAFNLNLTMRVISFVAFSGIQLLLPFYLENVLGYSPRQVGFLLTVIPLSLGSMALISGMLSDRLGTLSITLAGLILLLIGCLTVSSLSTDTTLVGYVLRLIPFGLGMGMFQAPNNSVLMGTVTRRQLGVVSSLLSVSRTLGRGMGIAILGALWASRVIFYAQEPLPGGATTAPVAMQVTGLQDVARLTAGIVGVALILGLWNWFGTRRQQAEQAVKSQPLS